MEEYCQNPLCTYFFIFTDKDTDLRYMITSQLLLFVIHFTDIYLFNNNKDVIAMGKKLNEKAKYA